MDRLRELEESIRAAMDRYPEFRSVVRGLGLWLESIADEPVAAPGPRESGAESAFAGVFGKAEPSKAPGSTSREAAPAPVAPAEPPRPAPIFKNTTLRLGDAKVEIAAAVDINAPKEFGKPRVVEPDVAGWTASGGGAMGAPLVDLDRISARCAVKRDACRWVLKKHRAEAAGQPVENLQPERRAIVERAKANPGCWVWMLDPHFADQMPGDEVVEMFAELYANLHGSAELADRVIQGLGAPGLNDETLRAALLLLAEAQSSLRVAAEDSLYIERENDQFDAFLWLKYTTQSRRVFLDRFMRMDNPGDPRDRARLASDIDGLRRRIEQTGGVSKERSKVLSKARYAAGRAAGAAPEDRDEFWCSLRDALESATALGIAPSDRSIREILIPITASRPAWIESDSALGRALSEADRFLRSRAEFNGEDGEVSGREPTEEVRLAASLLEGKSAVIIGGIPNEPARASLQRDLHLADLRWITTREHQSTAPFEPEVARAELVIALVRFSGHAFIEDLGEMCGKYDKPFVRVPAGYNTNQVAHHVLKQASRKLSVGAF